MAKLTIDQRIKKLEDSIAKEELQIEVSRTKIREFNQKLKALREEKNRTYANDFIRILAENGLTSESEKAEFMQEIQKMLSVKKADAPMSSPNTQEEGSPIPSSPFLSSEGR